MSVVGCNITVSAAVVTVNTDVIIIGVIGITVVVANVTVNVVVVIFCGVMCCVLWYSGINQKGWTLVDVVAGELESRADRKTQRRWTSGFDVVKRLGL